MTLKETVEAIDHMLETIAEARVELWESSDQLADVTASFNVLERLAKKLKRAAKKNAARPAGTKSR